MKELNNKGYITVEILIASIIAIVIAVFLIELTVKLVSKSDDAYVDTILTTDKVIITNQIMDDINGRGLYELQYIRRGEPNSGLLFTFSDGTEKELYVKTEDDKHRLIYGNPGESYIKNFNISFNQVSYDYSIGDYIAICLTLKTTYSDKNYGFSMVVPKNE